MCSFLVWKNACLNYRKFDLEGDLVGVPHTWYLSAQSFIRPLKLVWREKDIVAMNEWKKKCVGLQRTWVSKRTVKTPNSWKNVVLMLSLFNNACDQYHKLTRAFSKYRSRIPVLLRWIELTVFRNSVCLSASANHQSVEWSGYSRRRYCVKDILRLEDLFLLLCSHQ